MLEDGFADDDGAPDDEFPVSRMEVVIDTLDANRTQMRITSAYDTTAALEQVLAMGVEQGITTALRQGQDLLMEGGARRG